MKTKVNPTAIKYVLTIMEEDIELVEKRKTEVWEAKKNDIVLKGFRKGHVPREHAETVVGYDNLYEDVIREIVLRGCSSCGEKIVGVGQVFIDVFAKDKACVVRAEVWIEPKVRLTDKDNNKLYEGLEFEPPEVVIEDGEVEAVIQRMRESAATTMTVERESQLTDMVVIDFEGKLANGEPFMGNKATDYQVVVGGGLLLADFEKQLVGVKSGEAVEIRLVFPATYPAKELVNQEAVFQVAVKEVKQRTLPEVNDDLAKQAGYADLVEAREKLRNDLALSKEQQSKSQVEQQLLFALLRNIEVDPIPQPMINHQIEVSIRSVLEGVNMTLEQYLKKAKTTEEDLKAQYQQTASTDVRARLILQAIAEAESFKATVEEENAALQHIAPQHPNLDIQTLRERIDMNALTLNIRVQKAIGLVYDKAVAKKKM